MGERQTEKTVLQKGINKVLGNTEEEATVRWVKEILWRRWQLSWLLRRTSRNFPREINLHGIRYGTWFLICKTWIGISRFLGRVVSYLKQGDEEGSQRLILPSEENTLPRGQGHEQHWKTKSETFQPEPPHPSRPGLIETPLTSPPTL